MNLQKQVTIFLSIFVLTVNSATSQNDVNRIGAWQYGSSEAVYADTLNDLVYLGAGGAVLIIDASDPFVPVIINEDVRTMGFVQDIWYRDGLLYLACGRGGLEIWDASDNTNPQLVSRTPILYFDTETPVRHIELYQNFAVLECEWGYIHTVDISDPFNPEQLYFNGAMGNPAHDMHIDSNGYVHTTGAQYYVRFSLGPDGSLTNAGQKEFITSAGSVFGRQDDVFVEFAGNMYILDLNTPGLLAWSITPVDFTDIVVRNNTAFLITQNSFEIWDVSDVQNPVLTGSVAIAFGDEIFLNGDIAYVSASTNNGLYIVDISNFSNPQILIQIKGYSWTSGAKVVGNIAYTTNGSGLFIVDVSDPYNNGPQTMGQLLSNGQTNDIAINGDYAYVTDWTGGLRVVDISDSGNPVEIANVPMQAWMIAASDNYVYVTDVNLNVNDNLEIYDISDPSDPQMVGEYTLPELTRRLEYNGGFIYAANYSSGLRIIDVSDPADPVEASWVDLPNVIDVSVEGNTAWVASLDWSGGLASVDITDPYNPSIIQIHNPNGVFQPFHVAVSGSYAYASLNFGDVYIFDISDPSNITELQMLNLPGQVTSINADNAFIYVADGPVGLQILENTLITGINNNEMVPAIEPTVYAYPIPTSDEVTIDFELPSEGMTQISVFDLTGRAITQLVRGKMKKGIHTAIWNCTDESGKPVHEGVYIYRINHEGFNKSGKLVVRF